MQEQLVFPLQSAFLALSLSGAENSAFRKLQNHLEPFNDILNLQNPETPHLTLQFWPSLMKIEYEQILIQAEKIAQKQTPFDYSVIGADTFGSRGDDRVLFLYPHFSDALARVKKSCPWPSPEEFHPHVTLARIQHPQKFAVHKKKIMKLLTNISFTVHVDRLCLYAKVAGASQTPLRDFPFGS